MDEIDKLLKDTRDAAQLLYREAQCVGNQLESIQALGTATEALAAATQAHIRVRRLRLLEARHAQRSEPSQAR